MSPIYFDTGVVLKLLVQEPESSRVLDFLMKRRIPIPYSQLVELETENTLQAKFHRKEITTRQLNACRALIRVFLSDGRFYRPALSLDELFLKTLVMLPKITAPTGCRTLDLLHIVSAHQLGCREFVTTDQRQAAAARLSGLVLCELD